MYFGYTVVGTRGYYYVFTLGTAKCTARCLLWVHCSRYQGVLGEYFGYTLVGTRVYYVSTLGKL